MSESVPVSRRDFLRSSVVGTLSLAAAGLVEAQTPPAAAPSAKPEMPPPLTLPRRKLGRTGVEVTILTLAGHMEIHNPDFLDRAWQRGIRYFDTSDCYKDGRSEKDIGIWIQRHPERRKELFLVTKDHPRQGPEQLITAVDKRLAALQTDYIDLFFIHQLGPGEYGEVSFDWPKSPQFKEVAEKLKKAGKIKFFGFSCHDHEKARYLNAAAEGGFIDALMVAYSPIWNPWYQRVGEGDKVAQDMDRRDEFNRALDKCHKAGVGLVAMKSLRGVSSLPAKIPGFEQLPLSTHGLVLHAGWSDERLASICSWPDTEEQMLENTDAAHKFTKPLTAEQLAALREFARKHVPA